MEAEMMGVMALAVGAIMAVLVPYILKAYKSGEAFDVQYFYGLVLSVVVAALVALPAEVDTSFRGLALLFLAGTGIQGAVNKGISVYKKKK
jgi:hypothetical protein